MTARVLLVGNPNSGKTSLFNALTGSTARVGNYPGVTVEQRVSDGVGFARPTSLVDLPGTYSLTARSAEEEVALGSLLARGPLAPSAAIVVVDATALRRGLYFALQCVEVGLPVVLALSLVDEARSLGLTVDAGALEAVTGCPVVPLSARTGEGLDALRRAVDGVVAGGRVPAAPEFDLPASVRDVFDALASRFVETEGVEPRRATALARWAVLSLDGDEPTTLLSPEGLAAALDVRRDVDARGLDVDGALVGARYARVDDWAARAVGTQRTQRVTTERIDRVLTHPVLGLVVFALVMALLFEALFSGSEPLVGLIEVAIGETQGWLSAVVPDGPLRDLLVSGVVAGVGNVIVFVPQIALLFLFITVLEDSGYLARVAFVIDRLMAGVGLHGKAFVPLLSGFACAVPAIISTRTLEDRRDRLVTMLALPLMSCSARLPVYVLVVATLFPGRSPIFGIFSLGAVVLFSLYAFSVAATLFAAFLIRRTVLPGPRPTLVLELPPYRRPLLGNVIRAVWDRVRTFLFEAGTTILALTIVLWAMLSFPRSEAADARLVSETARIEATIPASAAREAALSALSDEVAQTRLQSSALGTIGRAIEPALEPLGYDWRIDVAILGAFAAREVFVSTLGIVFGLGEADETSEPLRESLRRAKRVDGTPLFDVPTGASLLVFFVLACQCMSTVAIVRRESGSWKWAAFLVAYMTVFAYVGAFVTRLVAMAVVGA